MHFQQHFLVLEQFGEIPSVRRIPHAVANLDEGGVM